MKVDFNKEVVDINGVAINSKISFIVMKEDGSFITSDKGEPLVGEKDSGEAMTYKDVAVDVLLKPQEGIDGKKLLEKFELAERIKASKGAIEIKVEEATMIQELVEKLIKKPLIYGRVYKLFNSK